MELGKWCADVCGGKCCRHHVAEEGGEVACPRLKADNTCSCYAERYADGTPDLVVVGYWTSRKYRELDGRPAQRPFFCGRIEQVHARGGLAADVAAKCAVLHPELLEEREVA